MAYATYEFYVETYHGTALDQTTFEAMADRASDYIDNLTMYKAQVYNDAKGMLAKACCCAAEEFPAVLEARASASGGELASEHVGSYSVSYRSGAEVYAERMKMLKADVEGYLMGTGLLYRGVPCLVRIP